MQAGNHPLSRSINCPFINHKLFFHAMNVPRVHPDLPILRDIEGPLEFQMALLIIVNEGGDRGVMSSGQHAGWSIFLSNYGILAESPI